MLKIDKQACSFIRYLRVCLMERYFQNQFSRNNRLSINLEKICVIPDLIKEISTMDRRQRKEFLDNLVFHNTITDRWSCRICHNSYTRKFTVVDHIEEKHLQLLSYPCDFCEAHFTSSNLKRKHQNEIHKKPMLYGQCIVETID